MNENNNLENERPAGGQTADRLRFSVPGISCGHCVSAITNEVSQTPGVNGVVVDLDTKTVTVSGTASPETIIAAIDEAGYDVVS